MICFCLASTSLASFSPLDIFEISSSLPVVKSKPPLIFWTILEELKFGVSKFLKWISRRFWFKREENKERKNMKKDEESTSNDVYDRKLLKNVEEVRFLYTLS